MKAASDMSKTKNKNNTTNNQLETMKNWLEHQIVLDPGQDILENVNVNPNQLNKYQRFTYDLIDKFNKEKKKLLMILLGTAGTGKSFTVSAITKLKEGHIKKASPTAKAAFLINGDTLHSLFNIPVDNSNRKTAFLDLENEALANLQKQFDGIDILIIDEFSMLGQEMFGKIDRRLKQAKNNNSPLDGISLILIGDPAQLHTIKYYELIKFFCKHT
jgi:DNA replication protein DnaC